MRRVSVPSLTVSLKIEYRGEMYGRSFFITVPRKTAVSSGISSFIGVGRL